MRGVKESKLYGKYGCFVMFFCRCVSILLVPSSIGLGRYRSLHHKTLVFDMALWFSLTICTRFFLRATRE